MNDPRFDALARQLVTYSLNVRPGERILLELTDTPDEMATALIRAVREQKADPFLRINHERLVAEMYAGSTDSQYEAIGRHLMAEIQDMDGYIAIRGKQNAFETSSVPSEAMARAMKHLRPVSQHRINKTRWCALNWPSPGLAQQAGMSTAAFEDFYFKACLMDYAAMAKVAQKLVDRMQAADRVRITGPGTDLSFSIKGIDAIPCCGDCNIPDGEVYTAPVRDSMNGRIQYNTPTVFQGIPFDSVAFVIKDGRIVEARANSDDKTAAMNKILDTDPGARYFGEFALGINANILKPMCNILFDEKIAGSFHLTPGQAYAIADNGNTSQIHWDLVCIQTKEYGGGEIYFDDELIRKDGIFLNPELAALNPGGLD